MKLTTEATKSAIASGKLAAFSLDTSVFESQQMALERGLLKRLQQFKGSKIKIVLADVVSREVIAHIQQRANSTKASVEKALAEVQNTWPTTKETCTAFMKQIFEQRSSAVSAELRFADFLESVGAEIAPCARVSLEVLTSKYFDSYPPFGDSAKRKSEFPDAISLMTLEAWAESNGVLMLVVSKDKAWSEYCVTSQCLVCTDDLSNALSVFQEESGEFACKQITKMILSGDKIGVIDTIKNAVRTQWA